MLPSEPPVDNKFTKEEEIGKSFISNFEAIAFVVLVIVILILLYPAKRIEEIVLKEEDPNYELSLFYLRRLIEAYPQRYDYKMAFARKATILARDDYVEALYKDLLNSENPKDRMLGLNIAYFKFKRDYFLAKTEEEKINIKKKIEETLLALVKGTNDVNELKEYFLEANSMDMPHVALRIALLLSNLDNQNRVLWLETAYKGSIAIKDYKLALDVLSQLISADVKHRKDWVDKKIELLLFVRDYKQAVNLCMIEMSKAKTYQDKKQYFKKALDILSWHNEKREIANLIRNNYKEFIQDEEMLSFMIKKALAIGDLETARLLALHMLN